MSEEPRRRLKALLEKSRPDYPPFPAGREDALALYLSEILRWRGAVNLVGALSEENLARHALESAAGAIFLSPGDTLLDIGSGAGLPGLVLAILGWDVTLLEPRERRAVFLRHVLRQLPGLNARVRAGRVEALRTPEFSAATSRGVGNLPEAIGKGEFLRDSGKLLLWISDPEALAPRLAPFWALERRVALPGAERREIALFRKRSTGNIGA